MSVPSHDAPRAPFASLSFARIVTAAAVFATLAGSFVAPAPALAKTPPPKAVLDASAVAVPDRYSADTAQQIFAAGGNAVDAAVAIAFTLAVTCPDAGNIGGGGFMTVFMDGKPYFLDYRERAPQQATRDMYLDDKGNLVPGMSLVGHRAVGVPGTVEGMWEAQQRFGKLKWKQVLAPAIRYATDGFQVDQGLQQRHDVAAKTFAGKTNFDAYFSNLKAGVMYRQPELAQTLSRERERALLFRTLATLRTDIALFDDVDQLRWNGPTPAFAALERPGDDLLPALVLLCVLRAAHVVGRRRFQDRREIVRLRLEADVEVPLVLNRERLDAGDPTRH